MDNEYDRRIEIPSKFENNFVPDDKEDIYFSGKAYNLRFSRDAKLILGDVRLTKYSKKKTFFGSKFVSEWYLDSECAFNLDKQIYFAKSIDVDNDKYTYYQEALHSLALENRLKLQSFLIVKTFSPIITNIEDCFNKIAYMH